MSATDGIVLVDKPAGTTSFAVVDGIRRGLVGLRSEAAPAERRRRARLKCGHAGTLDPLATGLLLVLVGRGVRLSRFLVGLDKSYTAVVRFGVGTDSHDRDGTVTARQPVPADPRDLPAALDLWRGEVRQIPPVISALKRGGQPLHRRVRRGEVVPEPDARSVRITRLELLATRWGLAPEEIATDPGVETAADGLVYEATLAIDCSSGTYVRSLARDIAAALGSVGHVHALRRTRVGPFVVEAARPAVELSDPVATLTVLRSLAAALPHLATHTIGTRRANWLRQGGQPAVDWLDGSDAPPRFKYCDPEGELVAVAATDPHTGAPRTLAVFGDRQPASREA
jgi:tRNA pseudouridine55 synthase